MKNQEYKVAGNKDLFDYNEEINIDLITPISDNLMGMIPSKETLYASLEDSQSFTQNLFRGKDIILNENWTKSETIQGIVVHIRDEEVFVDCLIDLDNRIFEHRAFPKQLFENILDLSANKSVIIKTRLKSGAVRIDVYSGDGIVNLELFELNENWDELINSGLDSKLDEW